MLLGTMKQQSTVNLKHYHKAQLEVSSYAFFTIFVSCLIAIACHTQQAHAESKKIVKWKDASGVTHYGDKMPAQEAGRSNSVLNNQGTVIKTNESFDPHNDKQEAEKLSAEQLRQDSALLASYSSAEEIDLALTRNLKSDQLALLAMRQRLSESQAKIKSITTMYAGKKMPVEVANEQKTYQAQVLKLHSDIASTELSIAQTKSRYDAYKTRYLELRPREKSLTYINASKKTLAELEEWKADAQNRLDSYIGKDLAFKRSGEETPQVIKDNIKQVNEEIARADEEIIAAKNKLKKSERSFSN